MIVLGVDWGRVRVGVAMSDELGLMAHPVKNLSGRSQKKLVEDLCQMVSQHNADRIVLGLPLHMNGNEGESAQAVRSLAAKLEKKSGRPVVLWDERLTTWEAESLLRSRPDFSPGKRRKATDQMAACLLLQNYLDSQKSPS